MVQYRIVSPELHFEQNGIRPEIMHTVKVDAVLWYGETIPDKTILTSVLEGQLFNRNVLPNPNFNHETPSPVPNSRFIEIQLRKNRFLGWKTLELIDIYGSRQ